MSNFVMARASKVTEEKGFTYYFDIAGRSIITISVVVFGFFAQRMVSQMDDNNRDINDLKIQVRVLETKLDYLIRQEQKQVKQARYDQGS